jgi:hypothetical protein
MILSTAQILSHNDLLYYVILIILYSITVANTISKLPEDRAEAPKHVGTFVILFNILIYIYTYIYIYIHIYASVSTNNR